MRTSALMATHLTADEVRAGYESKMGATLGVMFNRFYNECAGLHWKWDEYVVLFGTKESRVDLLNRVAPGFFRIVEDALWEDVLLHICRLTDDPDVGRRHRQTLSVRRLPTLVASEIQREVRRRVTSATKKCDFARDWRDRHIAHKDLQLALEKGTTPLAKASRRRVNDAINSITAVLQAVESHYCDTTTAYELGSPRNAEALLYCLRDGLDARADRLRRFRAGEIGHTELRTEPI
jgi:HEPN superfamily AbiU2-like protein